MRYDVVVVGAGPSGCAAAMELAKRGVDVCVVDKNRFPRWKPCAGGLSPKVRSALGGGLWPKSAVELKAAWLKISRNYPIQQIYARAELPIGWLVERAYFDSHLMEKAKQSGAHFLESNEVVSLRDNGSMIEVRTNSEELEARWVIGADGSNSLVARRTLGQIPWERTVSLVSELPASAADLGLPEGVVLYDFTEVPHGYGWVFPRDGVTSLGVGAVNQDRKIKKRFNSMLEKYVPEPLRSMAKPRAHLIPRGGRSKVVTGRAVALVGDAAGLVDPILGEGIYYALISGKEAARCIYQALAHGRDHVPEYRKWLRWNLDIPFRLGRVISMLFYSRLEQVAHYVEGSQGSLLWVHRWMAGAINYYQLSWSILLRLPKVFRALISLRPPGGKSAQRAGDGISDA